MIDITRDVLGEIALSFLARRGLAPRA